VSLVRFLDDAVILPDKRPALTGTLAPIRMVTRGAIFHIKSVAGPLHNEAAMFDLRYALRQLRRSPGFTIVALVTLTLGMGANTAFFSVLYGVVLREPPYPGADRLVTIQNRWNGLSANGGRLSRAEFNDYSQRQRAFEGMAAASLGRMTLTSRGDRDAFAERIKVSRVTANLFSVLGVAPTRGRARDPATSRARRLRS
jgi:hypothetical protein